MRTHRPGITRSAVVTIAGLAAVAVGLAGCGSDESEASQPAAIVDGKTDVVIAAVAGAPFTATTVSIPVSESIRASLPAAVRDSGELKIGVGALPSGFPPLAFVGSDQKTLTGSEPDLGVLIAAVLGLKPVLVNATWENMFVGFDSGRTDIGFSNITVTEQRKEKYDFASYRQDNLGWETLESSPWSFNADYKTLAGKTVSVSSGTNQEKILLEWKAKLKTEGKDVTIKHFPDANSVNLALSSGQIEAYFGPNPTIAYHVAQTKGTPKATKIAGTWSGAGETLQGLIAATTKKGGGLAKPVADALNYLIENGQYATWLKVYGLDTEAVKTSEVNPPGLPKTNS